MKEHGEMSDEAGLRPARCRRPDEGFHAGSNLVLIDDGRIQKV